MAGIDKPEQEAPAVTLDRNAGEAITPNRPIRTLVGVDLQELCHECDPVGAKGSFSMIIAPEHLASRFKDPTLPRCSQHH